MFLLSGYSYDYYSKIHKFPNRLSYETYINNLEKYILPTFFIFKESGWDIC